MAEASSGSAASRSAGSRSAASKVSPLGRSLRHYRRRHLAVAAGAAIASAVLAGALLVGDSVRHSLQALTLDRLGAVDQVLAAEGFLDEDLGARLLAEPEVGAAFPASAGALVLPSSVTAAESGALASNVTLLGVGDDFLELYPPNRRPEGLSFDELPRELPEDLGGQRLLFPPVVLNAQLAAELGVGPGDEVLFAFTRFSEVPRASLMGRKGAADVVQKVRLSVVRVIEDRGPGAFSLSPHQGAPRLAFVSRSRLQRVLDQRSKINLLMLAGESFDAPPVVLEEGFLDAALRKHLTLEDLSLRVESRLPPQAPSPYVSVESARFLLPDAVREAVDEVAKESEAEVWPSLSYLANRIRRVEAAAEDLSVPYSSILAVELPPEGEGSTAAPFGSLATVDGPVQQLEPGEVLLNRWAAEELGAEIGEELELTYFAVGEDENLVEDSVRLRLGAVVELEGLAADPALTPEFPGISGSEDIADWDPPFELDLGAIRPQDEEYWDLYRGTPKAYVELGTGQELWRSRFGALTSIRLASTAGAAGLEGLAETLRKDLLTTVDLDPFGLSFEPARQKGLEASRGATDFGQLFVAFSWFLIVAAALLVGLLFRLGVEERAKEVGLLRALGFPARQVRRQFLVEGLVVATVGALVGLIGAVLYGWAMVWALSTWWRPAVGSSRLELSVTPAALSTGLIAALVVVSLTLWFAVRRLGTVETPRLLAGVSEKAAGAKGGSGVWSRRFAILAGLAAFGLGALAILQPAMASASLFFGIGALVLIAGLTATSAWMKGRQGKALALRPGSGSLFTLALGNAARNSGRSVLAMTLVACASFVLVLVASNRRVPGGEMLERTSGAGGFALIATTDAPLFHNLTNPEDRFDLGLGPETEAALDGLEVFAIRRRPGDDASCLNLYQPEDPTLLGVPRSLRQRGGFTFQAIDPSSRLSSQAIDPSEASAATSGEISNPWSLLDVEFPSSSDGFPVVPAIADFETAQWILKVGIGEQLTVEDARGNPVHLRFVALLSSSIFQSEVLVAEEALLEYFPGVEGFTTFLVGPPGEGLKGEFIGSEGADAFSAAQVIGARLESDLVDFGFDSETTAQRLATFKAVQNTYLSTFQTLGGLGLLLGTLGLAVVLLRNVHERRGELAVMRAFGFSPSRLRKVVLLENILLLLLGLALGCAAALLAAAPYLFGSTHQFPWTAVAITLGSVFIVGSIACYLATTRALRSELVPALRSL